MYKSNNMVIKLLLGILFSSINFLYAQNLTDWENPHVNGIKKSHSRMVFWQMKSQTTPRFNRLALYGSSNGRPLSIIATNGFPCIRNSIHPSLCQTGKKA